jgi:hypothetical protein
MRLTINLDEDLYRMAKAQAAAEDCSISAAVNRLLRQLQEGSQGAEADRRSRRGIDRQTGLPAVPCRTAFNSVEAARAEFEEDAESRASRAEGAS